MLIITYDTMQGVQLYIGVMDDDAYHPLSTNRSDDLIDILLIDHSLPIGEETSTLSYHYDGRVHIYILHSS